MTSPDDRKMFAPLRRREAVSPEAKLCTMLAGYEAGTIASHLAEDLARSGLVVGTRSLLTKRVGEMLEGLEEDGRAVRTPDGRYRAVPPPRRSGDRG